MTMGHDRLDAAVELSAKQRTPAAANFPTIQNRFTGPGTSLVARLTHTISPTLLNDFVASYVNSNITLVDQNGPGALSFSAIPRLDQPLVPDPLRVRPCAIRRLSVDPVSGIPQCAMGISFNNGFGGKMPGVAILGTNAAYGGRGFAADPSYMPWSHTESDLCSCAMMWESPSASTRCSSEDSMCLLSAIRPTMPLARRPATSGPADF